MIPSSLCPETPPHEAIPRTSATSMAKMWWAGMSRRACVVCVHWTLSTVNYVLIYLSSALCSPPSLPPTAEPTTSMLLYVMAPQKLMALKENKATQLLWRTIQKDSAPRELKTKRGTGWWGLLYCTPWEKLSCLFDYLSPSDMESRSLMHILTTTPAILWCTVSTRQLPDP